MAPIINYRGSELETIEGKLLPFLNQRLREGSFTC